MQIKPGELTHEVVKAIHKPRQERPAYPSNKKAKGLATTLNEFVPDTSKPWNKRCASHALRRLQFGFHINDLNNALSLSPGVWVDQKMDEAVNAPLPAAPPWENKTPPHWTAPESEILTYFEENFELYIQYQKDWVELMKSHLLREKMVLFWHNHFVTEIGKYELAPYAYRHFTTLRTHALGNFKEFVRIVGLDEAMLIYLDGVENRVGEPNENYARELLELFTMGIGNYSQNDIEEISRALTGYWVDYFTLSRGFSAQLHDQGEKTFFGRTGNFGYDDVIDIIFEEKAQEIATFICTKLYRFFVYESPSQAIINELAALFIQNDFEIEPVVRKLLKSEHFFDPEFYGAKIKSPLEFMVGMQLETAQDVADGLLDWQPWQLMELGQFPFNPVNVAGWPGYRSWISTTTFPLRWQYGQINVYFTSDNFEIDVVQLARDISDSPNVAAQLARDFGAYMLGVSLTEDENNKLAEVLLGGIPAYEWSVDAAGAHWKIKSLMSYIRQLPEYQLT